MHRISAVSVLVTVAFLFPWSLTWQHLHQPCVAGNV